MPQLEHIALQLTLMPQLEHIALQLTRCLS